MLPWQARALFPLLLRKVDRAGILQLGKHGSKGLAHIVGMPVEVVDAGLAGLLEDGAVVMHGDTIVIRNYIEAQEAASSDAQRKRDSRERQREAVTKRDSRSQNVTRSHDESRAVTSGHSVPSLAVPSRTQEIPAASAGRPACKPEKAPKPKSERPRWSEVIATYHDAWVALHSLNGKPPVIDGADVSALARVYDAEGVDETISLVQRFVSDADPFITQRGHMLRDLPSRVNAYRAKPATKTAAASRALPQSTSVSDETRRARKF
jgi:hypothetical protein